MINGTDLSHWDEKIDYAAMKAAGIRFAYLKLGQGGLGKDHLFDQHKAACIKYGIAWGTYWFCDYRLTGTSNAEQFVKAADGDFGQLTPVFDVEFYDGFGVRPPGAKMLVFTLNAIGEFRALTHRDAALYTNRDMLHQFGTVPPDLLQHELWIASGQHNPNPSPWTKWTVNQFGLDLPTPWAHGNADLNEFWGDEAAFQLWINSGGPIVMPTPALAPTWQESIDAWARTKGYAGPKPE